MCAGMNDDPNDHGDEVTPADDKAGPFVACVCVLAAAILIWVTLTYP
jgi:hypothetical protein